MLSCLEIFGTRGGIGTLQRNSQYIAEGISNREVNPAVQGGLSCLHYEDDFGYSLIELESCGSIRMDDMRRDTHIYRQGTMKFLHSSMHFVVTYGIHVARFGNGGSYFANHIGEARPSACLNFWVTKKLCPRWCIESLNSPEQGTALNSCSVTVLEMTFVFVTQSCF